MPRFIYQGHALALGGHVSQPIDHHIEPQAACVLPSTGGRASSRVGPYSLRDPKSNQLLLSFDSAETRVQAEETASKGVHSTEIVSMLTNLNVGDVLKADAVICRLSLLCDTGGGTVEIDTEGSRFVNLTVGGEPWEVTVDHALGREASDYAGFRRRRPEYAETRGAVRHSLARHARLKFDQFEHGHHHHPDFGRIYFAEWKAAPYSQGLTMLRLELGSPMRADFSMAAADGNGQSYP